VCSYKPVGQGDERRLEYDALINFETETNFNEWTLLLCLLTVAVLSN